MKLRLILICVVAAVVAVACLRSESMASSVFMVQIADVKVSHAQPAEALIHTLVLDSAGRRIHEDWWTTLDLSAKATLTLVGVTAKEKSLFGRRWTASKRELKVVFQPFQDLRGTQNGLTYEVQWTGKRANRALQPTAASDRG